MKKLTADYRKHRATAAFNMIEAGQAAIADGSIVAENGELVTLPPFASANSSASSKAKLHPTIKDGMTPKQAEAAESSTAKKTKLLAELFGSKWQEAVGASSAVLDTSSVRRGGESKKRK